MSKNLTSRQARPLSVTLNRPDGGSATYSVAPPSASAGEVIAKMLVLGINAVTNANLDENDIRAALGDTVFEAMSADYALDKLVLGDAWDQMHADNLWGPDVAMTARYAAFYFIYGEQVADQIVAALDPEKVADPDGPDAAFPTRSPSGPSTASATPTAKGSTSGTGHSRRTSAKSSKPRPVKGRASRGTT